MQSDYHTLYSHSNWANARVGELSSAWYERRLTVPQDWAGRWMALA